MNLTHSGRVAALAHHLAFFTIMAVATRDGEGADQEIELAMGLWLGQHGYDDPDENLALAAEAVKASSSIMVEAVRSTAQDGKANPSAAGRLILRQSEDAGLSHLWVTRRALH